MTLKEERQKRYQADGYDRERKWEKGTEQREGGTNVIDSSENVTCSLLYATVRYST